MGDPNAGSASSVDPLRDWLNLDDYAQESDLDVLQARTRADRQAFSSSATRTAPLDAAPRPHADLGHPSVPGYEIVELLGRGGMGVVFKARHLALGRFVALKMLFAGNLASAREVARLKAEAAVIAQLQHPNIVQIYEIGEHEGRPFLALEFVDGGSLDAQLAGQPQSPRGAAALVAVLARTMHAAHEKGVVHRDLKPGNVLLARRPGGPATGPEHATSFILRHLPKITDFGLAKTAEGASTTQTGEVVGTPSYMAPEQASALHDDVGPAADIYALGAILYEMLAGRPPFRGVTAVETLLQVQTQEPVPPRRLQPKLPVDLEVICLKCLRKEPAERYPSALALAEDLRRFLYGLEIEARPVSVIEKAWKWSRRNPWLAATSLLSAVLLIGLFGGWLWQRRAARLREATVLNDVRWSMGEAFVAREKARQTGDPEQWRRAAAAAEKADALLKNEPGLADRRDEVGRFLAEARAEGEEKIRARSQQEADDKMRDRVNRIQSLKTTISRGRFLLEDAIPGYAQAFKDYGFDLTSIAQMQVVPRLRHSRIAGELAAALEDWASLLETQKTGDDRKASDAARPAMLRRLANDIDPDPFRARLRVLTGKKAGAALKEDLRTLAAYPEALAQPPLTIVRLANALRATGEIDATVAFLRKAQERHPSDFWISFYLGIYLLHQQRPDEAARFFTVAVAMQPQSPGAWFALGLSLGNQAKFDEAADAYRKALVLKADYAEALGNLALIRQDQGQNDEAISLMRRVTEIDPDNPVHFVNLAQMLKKDGQRQAALAAFQAALAKPLPDPNLKASVEKAAAETSRQVALAQALPARGAAFDGSAADLESLADLCFALRRYGQAADSHAALPPDRERRLGGPKAEERLQAIASAAKAATADSQDQPPLSDEDRKRYRRLALSWLTQDLAKLRPQLSASDPGDVAAAREALRRLQVHGDLAGLRGDRIVSFPAGEQAAWRRFWADVAELRRQAYE